MKGALSFDDTYTVCADAPYYDAHSYMAYESRAHGDARTLSRELIETFIRNYVFFYVFNIRTSIRLIYAC